MCWKTDVATPGAVEVAFFDRDRSAEPGWYCLYYPDIAHAAETLWHVRNAFKWGEKIGKKLADIIVP